MHESKGQAKGWNRRGRRPLKIAENIGTFVIVIMVYHQVSGSHLLFWIMLILGYNYSTYLML